MSAFLKWFFAFISEMLKGFGMIFGGIGKGIVQIFNVKNYVAIFKAHSGGFSAVSWILAVLAIIVVVAVYVLIAMLIILALRKYIRFRHSIVSNEDLLEEISVLQQRVMKMAKEKDEIMAMKVAQMGLGTSKGLVGAGEGFSRGSMSLSAGEVPEGEEGQMAAEEGVYVTTEHRFARLFEVDSFYKTYVPPEYDNEIDLVQFCERYRNFACSRMRLYYEPKIIRLFVAGMASTKLIILQGISGTGKTSLPYSFGKFLGIDTTIASVQPSWRDRTELFGYFNEFTKNFNETEVLRRIYAANYNDDINMILLDEMNIARIEYYFAEMLSILEMPNADEWQLDLVPSVWSTDPEKLNKGKLKIPQNIWYIGTANNDDSTFAISDKVYDRAQPINLDAKGVAFEAPDTPPINISFTHLNQLFQEAYDKYPISEENLKKIHQLDLWVIEKLRVAFGNRIIKQMGLFVPVYVACGGDELDGIDYVLATKIFRKFESLNLAMLRDELKELCTYLNKVFGRGKMNESIAYLERLQKLF